MIREIYTRTSDEYGFEPNTLEHKDLLESVIQKIKMIMCTSNGDVLGSFSFGANLEDLIFTTVKDADYIEKLLNQQFSEYIHSEPYYKISTKVRFGHHKHGYDFAIVDVYINNKKMSSFLIN